MICLFSIPSYRSVKKAVNIFYDSGIDFFLPNGQISVMEVEERVTLQGRKKDMFKGIDSKVGRERSKENASKKI